MKKVTAIALLLPSFAIGLTISNFSYAGDPEPEKEYKASYCKEENAACGVVAYLNDGGYVVKSVTLRAKSASEQKDKLDVDHNPKCIGVSNKIEANLANGEFHQFIVPATCRYKLKINISSGEKKDKGLIVTPGCIIVAQSGGTTTTNNKIKKKKIDFVDGLSDDLKELGKANCKI